MKRGSAQNPGCKAQIAVATDYEPPGRRQIRHPPLVYGPFGGAGCGKIGPSLTCREGALQGRDEEGRARRARGDTPRAPTTLPGGADWLGVRAGRKDRVAGSPRPATAGGPDAAGRPRAAGGGVLAGAARSPAAARAPASRAAAAAAAATAAAAPPRRLLHLCGGSSGSARRRHQQQHSETSLLSRDPTLSNSPLLS